MQGPEWEQPPHTSGLVHLRTPAEGLQDEYTKPGVKKNRFNTGASVSVCAGISNGKVPLWEELPKKWCGQAAADLYEGAILKALKKHRPNKRKYRILEDNDPTGYKSGKAVAVKKKLHIEAVPFPRYSPDLNPLDFSIWAEINSRMAKATPKKIETVKAYKARLRRTALRLPKKFVRKAVLAMPKQQVLEAKGKNIPRD